MLPGLIPLELWQETPFLCPPGWPRPTPQPLRNPPSQSLPQLSAHPHPLHTLHPGSRGYLTGTKQGSLAQVTVEDDKGLFLLSSDLTHTWALGPGNYGKCIGLADLLPKALLKVQFDSTKKESERDTNAPSSAFSTYTTIAVHLLSQQALALAVYMSVGARSGMLPLQPSLFAKPLPQTPHGVAQA